MSRIGGFREAFVSHFLFLSVSFVFCCFAFVFPLRLARRRRQRRVYAASVVQVVARWCTQRGMVAILRSQDPTHMVPNRSNGFPHRLHLPKVCHQLAIDFGRSPLPLVHRLKTSSRSSSRSVSLFLVAVFGVRDAPLPRNRLQSLDLITLAYLAWSCGGVVRTIEQNGPRKMTLTLTRLMRSTKIIRTIGGKFPVAALTVPCCS